MKTKGYNHQNVSFDHSKDLEFYGIWWEPGLGKSKLVIDTACHLWLRKRITGLLVVAPNGVHSNIVTQEMPVHMWDNVPWHSYIYHSNRAQTKAGKAGVASVTKKRDDSLAVLVMSYSAIKTKEGFERATEFLKNHTVFMVIDESTAIAEPNSQISKKCKLLGPLARYRRVMSGTPVAEGPFKIYNPMKFLSPDFWSRWGYGSYYVFKNAFALFKKQYAKQGHSYEELLEYRNIDHLQHIIKEHSTRVLKEDALDLPPKVYSKVEFELEPKQRKIYDELVDSILAVVDDDHNIEALSALVRLTRLQQLTSGYAVTAEMPPIAVGDLVMYMGFTAPIHGEIFEIDGDVVKIKGVAVGDDAMVEQRLAFTAKDPMLIRLVATKQKTIELFEPKDNPRLQALGSILEPISHKVIIWARFTRDIELICQMLGTAAVRYDGQTSTKDRETALHRFRTDDTIRYFVANQQAISMGVTLTQAKTVVYYSNTFALEKRLQSEDRAHRIGQDTKVNIIDLVAKDTVDEHIVETLQEKFDLAATVTGDRFREWIRA